MIEIKHSPLQSIKFRGKNYLIKRDDLIDDRFSGNKARKLHYYLDKELTNYKKVISHGSPQSNAMYSISELAKIKGLEFDYYVDHIADYLLQNPVGNYARAIQNNINIIEDSFPNKIDEDSLFIPEGGHFKEAEYGIKRLADELKEQDKDIFLPSGTGTTALYLQKHLKNRVYTCACVGGDAYLKKQFFELESDEHLHPIIINIGKKYHFGKLYKEFFEIWIELKNKTGIEFDLLYDPLGWLNVLNLDKEVLYIHQGGVIGNESMLPRYKRKFIVDKRKKEKVCTKEINIKENFIDLKFLLLEKFHILEKLSLEKGKERGFDTEDMIMCGRVATLLDNGQNNVPKLSKTLGISRQATHKAVGKLAKKGFVQMQDHQSNKKVKVIVLTPLGEQAFAERKKILQDIEDKISEKIGQKEIAVLKEILMQEWD